MYIFFLLSKANFKPLIFYLFLPLLPTILTLPLNYSRPQEAQVSLQKTSASLKIPLPTSLASPTDQAAFMDLLTSATAPTAHVPLTPHLESVMKFRRLCWGLALGTGAVVVVGLGVYITVSYSFGGSQRTEGSRGGSARRWMCFILYLYLKYFNCLNWNVILWSVGYIIVWQYGSVYYYM